MKKIIIAGGRNFYNYNLLKEKLDKLKNQIGDFEIVSGKASGADSLGEKYAKENRLIIHEFYAPWNDIQNKPYSELGKRKDGSSYWKLAGPFRNEQMAKFSDGCIVFWDGKSSGTKNMIELAKKYKLSLAIIRYE